MDLIYHILKYFYHRLFKKNLENNPRWFPLSSNGSRIKTFDKPFLSNNDTDGFFTRFYKTKLHISKFLNLNLNLGKYFFFKYEIIKAKTIYKEIEIKKREEDFFLPISTFNNSIQKFLISDETTEPNEVGIFPERYTYLNFKKNSKVKISSKKRFIVGEPIAKKTKHKNKYNLVILVLIDGFSNQKLDKFNIDNYFPNINDFFNDGILFKNNFCNAEWTLPSVPSFFTGMRQQNHGFYHNKKFHTFRKDTKLLPELFKDKNYLTLNINSNPRISPLYGYVRGFDRTIHKLNFSFDEICNEVDEHINTFKERDKFIFINLFDLHDTPHGLLSLEAQSNLKNEYLTKNTRDSKIVSPVKNKKFYYDEIEIQKYLSQLKKVDRIMERIFDTLQKHSKNENSIISLVTDHGHPFTENTTELLSKKRMNVPWYIKAGGVGPSIQNGFTENVDFFSSLVNLCELNKNGNINAKFKEDFLGENNTDSILPKCFGGSKEREFVFIQSIYNNQPYISKIIDNEMEFLLETKESISSEGKINLEQPIISHNGKINTKKIVKYKDYCVNRANDWNSSIDNKKFPFEQV